MLKSLVPYFWLGEVDVWSLSLGRLMSDYTDGQTPMTPV